ncbi:unnamed protein product [Caenorhabditis auriculariae]|uniref:Tyrosine-protein phosphatase domain-containing protein n=1 Tax=Caenorhabditis auriculariae TaxID=2777116 RepID=A0A8S1HX79_9PELO|nr:unnamed protein product [Caenorhabditis auriculariae]
MKWNRIEGRFNLKMLLMIALLNACYADSTAYAGLGRLRPNRDAHLRKVKWPAEALVYVDQESRQWTSLFVFICGGEEAVRSRWSETDVNFKFLKRNHPQRGRNLSLIWKKIEVDDVSIYCDGTTDLIKIVGSIPQDIVDRLHRVGNKTLEACKSLTTTQPTVLGATQRAGVPRSNSSAAVISQLCTQKIDAEKEKCSSNNTLLYIACAVIVVLLIVSIVSTIIALKLYLWRHKKDLLLASFGSHAAQVIEMILHRLCDGDCRILKRVYSDRHADNAFLAYDHVVFEKKLTARRFWKVQQGKKLDFDNDFKRAPAHKVNHVTSDELFRLTREGIPTEDVQEALQKYEEVKTSIVKSGKFDPPKNVNPISDTRQRNRELMAAMKSASQKKVKPGAPFYKDPSMLSKAENMITNSDDEQPPKRLESKDQAKLSVPASKDKVPAPQTNRKPAGAEAAPKKPAPAKKDAKKPPSQETTSKEPVGKSTNDTADRQEGCCSGSGSGPREPEVDPKYAGQFPKEVAPRSLCKPMRVKTSACPEISNEFSGESDELKQTFTALTMIFNKAKEVMKVHEQASVVIAQMMEDSVVDTRGAVYETTVLREREGDLRIPLVRGCPCKDDGNKGYNVQDFLNDLNTLRHTDKDYDPELYELLESGERIRAQKLGAAGKNYSYFWNKKTTTAEAVLPGETFERAMIRKEKEMEDLNRITDLYKVRKCRLPANRKGIWGYKKGMINPNIKKKDTKKSKEDKKVASNHEKKEKESEKEKNKEEEEDNKKEEGAREKAAEQTKEKTQEISKEKN